LTFFKPSPLAGTETPRYATGSSTFSQGSINISKFVGNILKDNIQVVSLRKI
jgi:hypothetical protein